ncbi:LOW QUALITY PROTEIN: leukocyte tyrosine kinase receptor [Hipposideros larvatus]
MDRSSQLLLWLRAAAPSSQDPNVTSPLNGSKPASPLIRSATEGPWQFTCGASGRRGPTQTQCNGAYAGSSLVVTVGAAGPLRGMQLWPRVPGSGQYLYYPKEPVPTKQGTPKRRRLQGEGRGFSIGFPQDLSLHAGGKGAKNPLLLAHGVLLSAILSLGRGELLYILVGQQRDDACPGGSQESQLVCLGESRVAEEHAATDGTEGVPGSRRWAGGGGGGGGATYVFRLRAGELEPLVVAAGGGGRACLRLQDRGRTQATTEKLESRSAAPGSRGRGGAAGGDASETDILWADGEDQIVSFLHPSSELYLQPLAGMAPTPHLSAWPSPFHPSLSPLPSKPPTLHRELPASCTAQEYLGTWAVSCDASMEYSGVLVKYLLAMNSPQIPVSSGIPEEGVYRLDKSPQALPSTLKCLALLLVLKPRGELTMWLGKVGPLFLLVAVAVTSTLSLLMRVPLFLPASVNHKKWQGLWGAMLPGPELELRKLQTSTIKTAPNPYYSHVGLDTAQSWPLPPGLTKVSPANVTLFRALGHSAFGEVYEGLVIGLPGDPSPLQVTIKTLPELCSHQDELDFLMEVLIISKFSHQNIVRCVGLSLQAAPRLTLELMSVGDMKSFLRHSRPHLGQLSPLAMQDLLQLAQDIAQGCHYLEENHFIHRDIAARNCVLSCTRPSRVAKIGDFAMARDIYRASYYRKGGTALLPVKWMPPEAFLEGITSKTDTWSFGVPLWEIFSLGYMPYSGTNQEVLDFVVKGGRMDPPRGCPGPGYRIMTQCQHQPELSPSLASILKRLQYCTQDPDVLNSSLPVELVPKLEEDRASGLGSRSLEGLRSPQAQELSLESLKGCGGSLLGPWLKSPKSRGLQPLNLWNPTYGSWAPRGPQDEDSGIDASNASSLQSSLHSSPGS